MYLRRRALIHREWNTPCTTPEGTPDTSPASTPETTPETTPEKMKAKEEGECVCVCVMWRHCACDVKACVRCVIVATVCLIGENEISQGEVEVVERMPLLPDIIKRADTNPSVARRRKIAAGRLT